jgi:AraC family transcriptional regulator
MRVEIRELPGRRIVYMRHVGPYGPRGIPELWARLRGWMDTRGLSLSASLRLGIAHDDARITEAARCVYDAGVVVPESFPPIPG